jgi:hypothetical protein
MWLKKATFGVGSILTLSLLFPPRSGQVQGGQRPAEQSPVPRYMQAIQKRDFKTLIDLTYSYQQLEPARQ